MSASPWSLHRSSFFFLVQYGKVILANQANQVTNILLPQTDRALLFATLNMQYMFMYLLTSLFF